MSKTAITEKDDQEPDLKTNACQTCGAEEWQVTQIQILGIGHYKFWEECQSCGLVCTREEDLY